MKANFRMENNQSVASPLKKPNFKAFLESVDLSSIKRQSVGLKSHRNSILLPTYEGFKDPLAENLTPRSPKYLFTKKKKSIDIQTHRSNFTSYATGYKRNQVNTEMDDFIKKYSHNINLRRISESNAKKNIKDNPFFNSPLIKNVKRTENNANVCETISHNDPEKPQTKMSPFRKKIQLLLSTLVHKKSKKPKMEKEIVKKPSLSLVPKKETKKEVF